MNQRVRTLTLCSVGTLVIGMAGGVLYSNHTFHRTRVSRLDNSLSAFATILAAAQNDMRQSTSNPSTPLEKAYQVNLKVDVGQLSALWSVLYPELIAQGMPEQDVQQIGSGLNLIDTNILPPGGTMDSAASVRRARTWITFFYNSMYPDNKAPQSNADYLSRLKAKVSAIAMKYRSYKADPNFQVR